MIASIDTIQKVEPTAITSKSPRRQYRQIDVEYNPAIRTLWTYMKPIGAPCFNLGMLEELRHNDTEFEKNAGKVLFNDEFCPVDYYVVASRNPRIFNFGGDLALFIMLIKSRDRDGLMQYARLCIDCIFSRVLNYQTSAITLSLVRGEALGGGFETALASNMIIAEKSARMGFPEIIFNLFPGMGAYSMLARRVGSRLAEELIASGNIYRAEELHKMGVIDILVPDGEGEKAVYDLVAQQDKRLNGLRAMYECRRHFQPVSYKEFIDIATIWVDASLRLHDKDLQMMSRLVRSQMRNKEQHLQTPGNKRSRELELAMA